MTVEEYNKSVELYADRVYRFILKNLGDEELAKDVVQDSFIKVWEKREQIISLTIKSYLFTVAYRTMVDAIRRRKGTYSLDEVYMDRGQEPANHELKEILNHAADKLPSAQKTVLLLRDYEGYKYEEIAQITGLSLEQVKVYLFRARKFLKNYLVSVEAVI